MNILLCYRGNVVLLSSFFRNDTSFKHGYSSPAIQENPVAFHSRLTPCPMVK